MIIKNQQGLSIIEMVVAMAVFILAMTLAIGLLMLFLQNPALISGRYNMERSTQIILDDILHDFKNYQLDYGRYPLKEIPDWSVNEDIYLINSEGEEVTYHYDGTNIYRQIGSGGNEQLNPDTFQFTQAYFAINPPTSPWEEPTMENYQPIITVKLQAETLKAEPQVYQLQSTAVSRIYLR
ncbi:hypothetical protein KKC88_05700 [Patescibacteria group bacterium]|nr:hypothetical protein [Patescibacteria group bacterium]MBU1673616.1 hypothetical protein [Patescibacteria group bacterium]MBU1963896.1 hypothetical protein [Patescibacteria group bacterium]